MTKILFWKFDPQEFRHTRSFYTDIVDFMAFHGADHVMLAGLPAKLDRKLLDYQDRFTGPWPSYCATRYNRQEALVVLSTRQPNFLVHVPHNRQGIRVFNPVAHVVSSVTLALDGLSLAFVCASHVDDATAGSRVVNHVLSATASKSKVPTAAFMDTPPHRMIDAIFEQHDLTAYHLPDAKTAVYSTSTKACSEVVDPKFTDSNAVVLTLS